MSERTSASATRIRNGRLAVRSREPSRRFRRNASMRRKSTAIVSLASARRLRSSETLRASLPWYATRSNSIVPASAPRAPTIRSSGGAKRNAQRNPLSVPRSHSVPAAARSAAATSARSGHFTHFMARSEHETDREVQPPALLLLAVGEVDADRADRGAEACAGADAEHRVVVAGVPGVAAVDEGGDPPGGREPVRVLDAADGEVASAHHRVAAAHAEALERVAAHRLVAAGAEEEGRRNALARARGDDAALGAHLQVVVARERKQRRAARRGAVEAPRGQRARRA